MATTPIPLMTLPTDANSNRKNDWRVLILAPSGRDADLISGALKDEGVSCRVCRTVADVVEQLAVGAAAAVIGEEALGESEIQVLASALQSQGPLVRFADHRDDRRRRT